LLVDNGLKLHYLFFHVENFIKIHHQMGGNGRTGRIIALPYLKIDTLEKKKIAHRQTASSWLNKLSEAGVLRPQKMGRSLFRIQFTNPVIIHIRNENIASHIGN